MRFVSMVVALALLVMLAFQVQADDEAKGEKGKKPEGTRGTITSIDAEAKTFIFRTGKKKDANAEDITVQFGESTKILKPGESGDTEVKADELKAKQRVAVVYETKDGKNLATKITLLEKKKKKKDN